MVSVTLILVVGGRRSQARQVGKLGRSQGKGTWWWQTNALTAAGPAFCRTDASPELEDSPNSPSPAAQPGGTGTLLPYGAEVSLLKRILAPPQFDNSGYLIALPGSHMKTPARLIPDPTGHNPSGEEVTLNRFSFIKTTPFRSSDLRASATFVRYYAV
ncbi:hypothetical protein F4780DRAFT_689574 [Xylariomycetidae sp. FL0641]|nr:hypothetical protein F4780DRAFT_689574 [Xylariomycetidae sp. FL0641]